jgi:undecaprenyl diphosphate synthase
MSLEQTTTTIPSCIGVIMDGNRRWAKKRMLPTLIGHQKGYEKIRHLVSWAKAVGIEHVIIYALSTENLVNRNDEEITYLLNLCRKGLAERMNISESERGKLRFIGELSKLPEDIQTEIRKLEEETKDFPNPTLIVALSYGGRAELLSAVKRLQTQSWDTITEQDVERELWTAGIPDPDLIIRTGGASRLSNFLPWQAVYSELYFTPVLWPDFSREEFDKALDFFATAKRNFGK